MLILGFSTLDMPINVMLMNNSVFLTGCPLISPGGYPRGNNTITGDIKATKKGTMPSTGEGYRTIAARPNHTTTRLRVPLGVINATTILSYIQMQQTYFIQGDIYR